MNKGSGLLIVVVAAMLLLFSGSPVAAETARVSKLTGTSFGAAPDRDLRPSVIVSGEDYLGQLAKQDDATAKISDVEVLFWRGAVTPHAIDAYQKLVTDNLAQGGYTYKVTGTQTANGQTITQFTAESNQAGRVIGYWQTSAQGMYLNWGRVSGLAAPIQPSPPLPEVPPAPAATPNAAQATAPPPAVDDKDAEIAQLKKHLAELEAGKAPPAGATVAPADALPAVPHAPVAAQAPDNVPMVPLEQSDQVIQGADGVPIVADKNGAGIDGIKLSQHDMGIGSPCIAVAPDGTIHVAFVEKHRTTFANAVYHRSSSDRGKTWTDAKNLSEDMVNIDVGRCQLLVDSQNRVYVVWRAGLAINFTVSTDAVATQSNLWFRELEGGKWSKIKPVSEICNANTQPDAALSFFAAVDAAGHAQVIWNVLPDKWHPELTAKGARLNGIGNGLVFESTLDGAAASKPREAFLAAITPPNPSQPWVGPSCDGLATLNGYCDSTGQPHFVAAVTRQADGQSAHPTHYELIENGKAGQDIDLPNASFHEWADVPTLLVDAKGKQHMISLFLGGEHPNIRDYPLGSDDEPTVIRAAVGLNGQIQGFQAYQGPGGRMVALMQMSDTGEMHSGDNFVSISTGEGKWSVPVNITNNAGRKTFHNIQTSSQSNIGTATACLPGQGAAAYDHDGHLLLLLVKNEYNIVLATAFGVNTAGGDTVTPTLRFLRF